MKKTEIKTKWLHELRYGGHKQVQGTLKGIKSDGTIGYCCLGVLEEKVLGNQVDAVKIVTLDEVIHHIIGYAGPTITYNRLKEDIIGNLELTDELMDMNDTGWSFVQIANYIEREWEV